MTVVMSWIGVAPVDVVAAAAQTAWKKRKYSVVRIAVVRIVAGCTAVHIAADASCAYHVVAVAYDAVVDIHDAAVVDTADDDADQSVPVVNENLHTVVEEPASVADRDIAHPYSWEASIPYDDDYLLQRGQVEAFPVDFLPAAYYDYYT